MRIECPRALKHRLAAFVRAAGRREACALLYGRMADGQLSIEDALPVQNRLRSRDRFAFPLAALQSRTEAPIGLFHSHAASLEPSLPDLAMFRSAPFAFHLIGARAGRTLQCRAFAADGQEISLLWQ
jgi:proteasome lid subunit RPN8/RPN11